jgi:putative tryptophan/tyrosine transport system substrate-binding protein
MVWPFGLRAQEGTLPVIGYLDAGLADASADRLQGFRKGLSEACYIEGQNVRVEYHWLEAKYDRLAAVVNDLVRRRVAVITTFGGPNLASVAKGATATVPIVFALGEDPVKLGLVASLARPGGNVTGVNFLVTEVLAKRLALLHEMVPIAVRVAVLSSNGSSFNVQQVREAARAIGIEIRSVAASTSSEIDAAFAIIAREHAEALFVAPGAFFTGRRVQLANLAARDRIPATYATREIVAAGGLMSYGPSISDSYQLVGAYAGRILKGEKPADLPVQQSTRIELAINLQTARTLGLTIPETLLATADEVIQ